jgi:mannose-6-phosphate isomerase-like protein (cupin superfamily)
VAERHHFPLASAAALAPSPGSLAADVFAHGTLSLEYYAPRGIDAQQAHARDELYIIASGSGWFVNGDVRHRFAIGDALFVPAGTNHRFEDFGDDFGAWVMFYGPAGGESGS